MMRMIRAGGLAFVAGRWLRNLPAKTHRANRPAERTVQDGHGENGGQRLRPFAHLFHDCFETSTEARANTIFRFLGACANRLNVR